MPYFILKARGESITTIEYFNILRVLLSTNQIGKLFFDFNSGNVQDKIYMILSAAFYIFAIFQMEQFVLLINLVEAKSKSIPNNIFAFKIPIL